MITITDTGAYRAEVDPLHRNTWPVRWSDDPRVLGFLTEHITVAFDGTEPAHVRWSWTLDDAEADRVEFYPGLTSRAVYASWRDALNAFAAVHAVLDADFQRRSAEREGE